MSPRPDVSIERTEQILQAAMTVFAQRGFHESRMDDIAEHAGVSKGTLYLYFKSKDEIISAMLEAFFAHEFENMQTLLNSGESAASTLLNIADTVVTDMNEMSDFLSIGFEFYAVAGRKESVREFLRGYYHEYRTLLVSLIQRGIDSGEFRSINPDDIAIAIIALFEGMNLLWVVDPESLKPDRMVRAGVSALVDGIRIVPLSAAETGSRSVSNL